MDAVSDPLVEIVAFMKSSQVGGTEFLNNVVGYFIDQDASPMLSVQPTLEIAHAWSKDRLAPMLRDTPVLRGKVKDVRTRDSGNTLLHKVFPGGHLTIGGANSAASLASRPVRVVLCDEVDRYPASAGTEGDPVDLAFKRSTTFWNKKKILISTPTVKDISRIEAAYLASDKRKYYVACPHCGTMMTLKWSQVKWPKDEKGNHQPLKAAYFCEHCNGQISDADKLRMVRDGEWRAEAPFTGMAGFFINELYSPWVSFGEMASNFLKARKKRDTLRVFVNTSLAETWDEGGEELSDNELLKRREAYPAEAPIGVLVIVAGVDVQNDRIEIQVVGFGKGEEAWSLEYKIFPGDPGLPIQHPNSPWRDLDTFLKERSYTHESGVSLRITAAAVDTGHHTKQAYTFCKKRVARRIYAVKGSNQIGAPLVGKPKTTGSTRVLLFLIGTSAAKAVIYSSLKMDEFGPGYIHFPEGDAYNEEYFKQLTAEKLVTRFTKGAPTQEWVQIRPRNEALDTMVYSHAALAILNPNFEKLAEGIEQKAEAVKDEQGTKPPNNEDDPEPPPTQPPAKGGGQFGRRRDGFIKGWRR